MPRITRYVLFQLLATFIVSLVGISVVMVVSIMAKEGMQQGLGIEAALRLLPYAFPLALRFSVPATMLMATCSVFGHMSADNEVIAIKSLGITPRVILRPALALAFCMSLAMIWLNDVAVTWGADGMRRVFAESVEEVVFRLLRTQKSYTNKHFSINVTSVQGRKLIQPTLVLRTGGDTKTIVAREAELRTDLENRTLSILLTDCTIESTGIVIANPATFEGSIPLSKATRRERPERKTSELALASISDEAIYQETFIRSLEQQMAAEAAYQMILGDFEQLGGNRWNELHHRHDQATRRLTRLHLEPWRRFAEGFGCLFTVMVGAPLAIRMRTANVFTTFASCFFPVLCIYYPLLMWTVDRAKDGAMPPYSVWLGNVVLMLLGGWLMRGVLRY